MKKTGLTRFTHLALAMLFMVGAFSLFSTPSGQSPTPPEKKNEFSRPKPSGPTSPTVPTASRYQKDKIFLEQADSLFRNDLWSDIKIVKGNVKFRQGNMFMYCDSAYFYPDDRVNCYGHVRMEQGDTLFIYADKLFYNGEQQLAKLRCGPTQSQVKLINKKDILLTDSLDYSLAMRLGWYDCGGELRDESTTLTSIFGQYSPETKDAEFFHDVVLVNPKDNYKMYTDTLYYNTYTHIARIVSHTIIEGENDTIITSGGTYNTQTGHVDLTKRSLIMHKDSNENVVTLEGDSIIYDKEEDISYAYSFRSAQKRSRPVVLTDTANKSVLIGETGFYDNRNRRSMATDYPLLMEYSREDTLFLRADTIRTAVMLKEAETDTLGNVVSEEKEYYLATAYNRARFFRPDIQGVADSITYVELDSMLYLNRKPMVWSDERQINGKIIEVHLNDSTADWVRLPETGLMMEHVDEDFYNQLSGKKMFATLMDQTLKRLEVEGNVLVKFLPQEEDSTYNKFVDAESSFLDIKFKDGDIDTLRMWPEVTGAVSPIGDIAQTDKLLPGAIWRGDIRPIRNWYGDKVQWEDGLGEITDELEEYFSDGAKLISSPVTTLPDQSDQSDQSDQLDQSDQSDQLDQSDQSDEPDQIADSDPSSQSEIESPTEEEDP